MLKNSGFAIRILEKIRERERLLGAAAKGRTGKSRSTRSLSPYSLLRYLYFHSFHRAREVGDHEEFTG